MTEGVLNHCRSGSSESPLASLRLSPVATSADDLTLELDGSPASSIVAHPPTPGAFIAPSACPPSILPIPPNDSYSLPFPHVVSYSPATYYPSLLTVSGFSASETQTIAPQPIVISREEDRNASLPFPRRVLSRITQAAHRTFTRRPARFTREQLGWDDRAYYQAGVPVPIQSVQQLRLTEQEPVRIKQYPPHVQQYPTYNHGTLQPPTS